MLDDCTACRRASIFNPVCPTVPCRGRLLQQLYPQWGMVYPSHNAAIRSGWPVVPSRDRLLSFRKPDPHLGRAHQPQSCRNDRRNGWGQTPLPLPFHVSSVDPQQEDSTAESWTCPSLPCRRLPRRRFATPGLACLARATLASRDRGLVLVAFIRTPEATFEQLASAIKLGRGVAIKAAQIEKIFLEHGLKKTLQIGERPPSPPSKARLVN